jgi:nucleotide-binding universal stress UspA family protein
MKTILLPYQDDEVADRAFDTAYRVARQFDSYIEGLFVLPQPQVIAGEGIALPGVYLTQVAEDGRRLADTTRARFEAKAKQCNMPVSDIGAMGSGPVAGWSEVEGLEGQVIGEYSRLFDLIVIGRSTKFYAGDWNIVCEAAMFESGRPVLVSSVQDNGSTLGTNIVVAWNGSTETARTIALAMPLLHRAEQVTVLTVEGGSVPGPDGEQVAQHLRCHGIPVNYTACKMGNTGIGETILAHATELGADLLVKGAYTHTRLRQMIFGGATRHILSESTIPVLFAH